MASSSTVHFVYVLQCADGSLYIGATDDLEARLKRHHKGACTYTATRRPVLLAYFEHFDTRDAAFSRERQLKRWTRAKKEALIAREFATLKRL